MLRYFLIALSTLFILQGCGGGGGDGQALSASFPQTLRMELQRDYTVYPGNKIIKTSDPSIIQIRHKEGEKSSIVRLVQGSANIIR